MSSIVDPVVPEPAAGPLPEGGGTEGAPPPPVPSGWRSRLHRWAKPWRQANRTARVLVVIGLFITLFFGVLALFGDQIAPYDQDQYRFETGEVVDGVEQFESIPRKGGPDGNYPMGTTVARFDVFSRVIIGAKLAMGVVILSTVLAMLVGVPLGLLSGYVGGRLDRTLVLVLDAIYAFPALLLSIIVAFMLKEYLDPGLPAAAVAVGVVYVPQYFRVIRNHTMSVKQEPFVEAARSLGAKPRTIVGRYIFFNVVQSVPVIFTLNAADAVLTLAGLGFLGYGVEYPAAEWGLDVSRAISDTVSGTWWTAFWPGVAIMTLVTGLTLLGEGMNDIINPLLRVKGYRGKVRNAREAIAVAASDAAPAGSPVEAGKP
jgi:peptide/nickel transport system permease protein